MVKQNRFIADFYDGTKLTLLGTLALMGLGIGFFFKLSKMLFGGRKW